jgi:hypothetical protein
MSPEQSSERRGGTDRRQTVVDRRVGLDRRRGPGRRLSEERRSAEEGRMSDEQFEFLMAMEEYKRLNAKPFPTWTEVLEVIKALGYSKVGPSTQSDGHQAPAVVGQDDPALSDSGPSR